MNVAALEARCRHCGWAFGKIESPYRRGESTALVPEPETTKPGVPRPASMDVSSRGGTTVIRYRARSRKEIEAWSLLLLTPVLMTAALVFYVTRSVTLTCVASGLLAMGLCLLLIVGLYPRELVVDDDSLTVYLGPLALVRHPRETISQLGVTDRVSGQNVRFLLTAQLDGRNVELLRVTRPLDGLYLEQELERLLGLADEPIPGEIFAPEEDRDIR